MGDESTRARIVDAAGPIFAEHGFEGATVRDICRSAGVNVASINYYFGDKQHLYLETVKYARRVRAERYPFSEWTSDISPEEKLYDFVSTMLRRLMALQSAPWQVKLLMREVMQPTEACRQLVRDYFKPIFESLLGVIDQLATRPLTADERIKVGFSIVGQCLHYRYASEVVALIVPGELREQFELERLADHITKFSLDAIRAYAEQSAASNRAH